MESRRVLIIAQNAILQDELTRHLTAMGYVSITALTGLEGAIAHACQFQPAFVLLPRTLVETSGAAEVYRQQFGCPVIVVTTASGQARDASLDAIEAPFSQRELALTLTLAQQRFEANAARDRLQARLAAVFGGSNEPVWDLDLHSGHFRHSPRALDMLGYTPDEIPFTPEALRKLLHADDEDLARRFENGLREGSQRHDEVTLRLRHKNGHWLAVLLHIELERDAAGKAVWIFGTCTDLSSPRQIEKELTAQRDLATQIVNAVGQGITVTDAEGRFVFINPAYTKLFGWEPAEMLGQFTEFVTLKEDRAQQAAMRAERRHGITSTYESRTLRADGTTAHVLITGVPRAQNGGYAGSFAVITDITERANAENALLTAERRSTGLAALGRELAEASTIKQAAIHILNTAQQLIGWEASWLHLWNADESRFEDVADFDTLDGKICEVDANADALRVPCPMAHKVMEEGPQIVLRTWTDEPGAAGYLFGNEQSSLSLMFVPIRIAERLIGMMSIQSYRLNAYAPGDLELLQALATHCAGALLRLQNADALQESEERFQLANRVVFNVIWDQDVSSKRIWWSDNFEKVYGHSAAAATADGEFWRDHLHPDDRDRVSTGVNRMLASTADSWSAHYRFRRQDGAYAYVEDRALVIRDEAGGARRLLGAMQDVTADKQAAAILQRSEERYRALVEWSPEPIVVHLDGIILYVNPAAVALWGVATAETLVGKPVVDLIHTDSLPAYLARMERYSDGDGVAPVTEMRLVRHDSSAFDAEIQSRLVEYAGAPAVYALIRDVTERKQVDKLRRESEERLAVIVDAALDAVVTMNIEGFITTWNAQAEVIFGWPRAEALGKPLSTLIVPAQHRDAHARGLQHYLASGKSVVLNKRIEVTAMRKNGEEFPVELAITPARVDNELFFSAFLRDISAQKAADAQRASLEAQLRESQKMQAIGTLAGGIAHDFNNILATILGNTELAHADAGENSPAWVSLAEIRKAAVRGRDLVQQILSFSRRQPTARKAMVLAATINEAAHLLRATLPGRIGLDIVIADALPTVLADATQIQQVVINLATNAMQAIRNNPGRIAIRLDAITPDRDLRERHPELGKLKVDAAHRLIRLAVTDDGPGMDATTVARIFEPFFTTKPLDEGTGLGLSVVHGIIEAHDGVIAVESARGQGTTFTIFLPVAESVVPAVAAPHKPTSAPQPSAAGVHILYLDDDDALIFLVRRILERRGYRVSGFSDQQEAVVAFTEKPADFDLVVSDYNMPGMSGLDVARAIRRISPSTPVVIASGFVDETLRSEAEAAGVRELIFKVNATEEFCESFMRLAQAAVATKARGD